MRVEHQFAERSGIAGAEAVDSFQNARILSDRVGCASCDPVVHAIAETKPFVPRNVAKGGNRVIEHGCEEAGGNFAAFAAFVIPKFQRLLAGKYDITYY